MIVLACDHAGFELKDFLKNFFLEQNITTIDVGTYNKESCDYPDFAKQANTKVVQNANNIGIYICGSGIGMSIAANRNKKIRAALCYTKKNAALARKHNDANVLVLGARQISCKKAISIVKEFLTTNFEGGRHLDRVNKL